MIALIIIGSILGIIGLLILIYYLNHLAPLRPKENGFEYVYVEDDGSAYEVDKDDQEYLLTEFSPVDGARPYIKDKYSQRTPDGHLRGFILRRRVPKRIKIQQLKA